MILSGQGISSCKTHSSQFKKKEDLFRSTAGKHKSMPGHEMGKLGHKKFYETDTTNPRAKMTLFAPDRVLGSLISVPALISRLSSQVSFPCWLIRVPMAENGCSRSAWPWIPTWLLCLWFQPPNIIWLWIVHLLTWILEGPLVRLDQPMDWFPLSQTTTLSSIKYGWRTGLGI